ncbi:hypothetical protein L207DRAFT_631929 [Hyaloscypha variabilis F]|uniref:Uncharacterized protein n=1 Tax=Hyaloscypha variabilis (strain UAMH 11265 / GT02V1 / F) TaxID=1149755 RepID=A0A2J6RU68_HYAVF|nr:hypothetical protein L207DRAFT_631929 [Hyaloscypha variabilis F]
MLCHVEGSDQHFVVIRHLFDEEEFHLIGPAIILRRRCDKDDKNASADEQEGVSRYCAPYVEDDEEDESYEQGLETHFPNAEEQEEEQERIPMKYQSPYAEDADDEEKPLTQKYKDWLEEKDEEMQGEERQEEEYFQQVLEFAKGVGKDEDLQTATAIAMSLAEGKEIDKSEQKEWHELVDWSQADGESEGDEDILLKKAIALSLEKDGDLAEGEQSKQPARQEVQRKKTMRWQKPAGRLLKHSDQGEKGEREKALGRTPCYLLRRSRERVMRKKITRDFFSLFDLENMFTYLSSRPHMNLQKVLK